MNSLLLEITIGVAAGNFISLLAFLAFETIVDAFAEKGARNKRDKLIDVVSSLWTSVYRLSKVWWWSARRYRVRLTTWRGSDVR
jgi:hypothetical protein